MKEQAVHGINKIRGAVYSPQPRLVTRSVKDLIVEIATAALLIYEPACRCLGDEGLHSIHWTGPAGCCDVRWGRLWGLVECLETRVLRLARLGWG